MTSTKIIYMIGKHAIGARAREDGGVQIGYMDSYVLNRDGSLLVGHMSYSKYDIGYIKPKWWKFEPRLNRVLNKWIRYCQEQHRKDEEAKLGISHAEEIISTMVEYDNAYKQLEAELNNDSL